MSALTVRLSDYESDLLENLTEKTGESKTSIVINGIRTIASLMLDDERTTRLSAQEFDDFLDQLEKGEKDPEVLAARERLMKFKPVWED